MITPSKRDQNVDSTLSGGKSTTGHQQEGFKDSCPRCGAKRVDRQIGLEITPDEYVRNLVEVFREVRRVLRDDGTFWLNLGDSYAANRSYQVPSTKGGAKHAPAQEHTRSDVKVPAGLKPKRFCMKESHDEIALYQPFRRIDEAICATILVPGKTKLHAWSRLADIKAKTRGIFFLTQIKYSSDGSNELRNRQSVGQTAARSRKEKPRMEKWSATRFLVHPKW